MDIYSGPNSQGLLMARPYGGITTDIKATVAPAGHVFKDSGVSYFLLTQNDIMLYWIV
jgi:hypothetical protein